MKKLLLFVLLTFCFLFINNPTPAQTGVTDILDKSSFLEVTLPKDTVFTTNILKEINTKTSKPGETIEFELEANFIADDQVVLSKKSIFKGTIIDITKTSLIGNTYDIKVEINSLTIPFKGDYKIAAHPTFNLKKHKKKKGFFLSIKKTDTNKDLLDNMENRKQTDKYKKDDDEDPIVINKMDKIDVVLDKPFTIIIKQ